MRKGAGPFASLLFIQVALVDDVTHIILVIDALDEGVVLLVVPVLVILDFLEVDFIADNFRLVIRVLGVFVLDEVRIGDRLVIERDFLDFLLGLLILVGGLGALGFLGVVDVVTHLLGPNGTLVGIPQQRTRRARPAHLHDGLGRETEGAFGAHDRLLAEIVKFGSATWANALGSNIRSSHRLDFLEFEGVIEGRPIAMKRATCQREVEARLPSHTPDPRRRTLSANANPQPLAACKSSGLAGNPQIPGDKSISHRALILGALAIGETTVEGLLEAGDVLNTASVLGELGASLARRPDGAWTIQGVGVGGFAEPSSVLDHGNSGTGVRLMMGAVATSPITATFSGDASLRRRPMGRVLDPLSRFGAVATGRKGGLLPLTLAGASDPLPITYTLPVPSAQVKSAILLAGLNAPGRTTVIEAEATRDHTERMLRHFGADVAVEDAGAEGRAIALTGYPALTGTRVVVPPDPSSAAFPLVAALLVPGSQVTLSRVMLNPTRAGLLTVLHEMGASISISNQRLESGETVADIAVRASILKPVETDPALAASMIDEFPILAIAAAFAEGTTRMNGLAELRVKESDRLAAVAAGLGEIGITCRMGQDWLEVDGKGPDGVPGGGWVQTHMDHRIAMSFLVAGLAARTDVAVDDTTFIATSFPSFIPMMTALGATFRNTAR